MPQLSWFFRSLLRLRARGWPSVAVDEQHTPTKALDPRAVYTLQIAPVIPFVHVHGRTYGRA